jgi:hypothetical protein
MRHFFIRAEIGKNAGRKQSDVDADDERAAVYAATLAHYKHARLSGVKLVGGPSNAVRFEQDATADELREQIMRRIAALRDAGVIDLEALPTPKGGIANQPFPGVDQWDVMGSDFYTIHIANCVNQCHAAQPVVSNSTRVDQCQADV